MKYIRFILIIVLLGLLVRGKTQSLTISETIDYINTTFKENKSNFDQDLDRVFKITDYGLLTFETYWKDETLMSTQSIYLKNIDSIFVQYSGTNNQQGWLQLVRNPNYTVKTTTYKDIGTEISYILPIILVFDNTDNSTSNKFINAFNHLLELGKKNPKYLTSDPFDK